MAVSAARRTIGSKTRSQVGDDLLQLPALSSTAEIAAFFRCSEVCIWEMIREGRLHAVIVGRSNRIPRSSVEQFLAKPQK